VGYLRSGERAFSRDGKWAACLRCRSGNTAVAAGRVDGSERLHWNLYGRGQLRFLLGFGSPDGTPIAYDSAQFRKAMERFFWFTGQGGLAREELLPENVEGERSTANPGRDGLSQASHFGRIAP